MRQAIVVRLADSCPVYRSIAVAGTSFLSMTASYKKRQSAKIPSTSTSPS